MKPKIGKDTPSTLTITPMTRRLRAGGLVAKEKASEKRKAMENIAANEFFKFADAYTPEEHFFPLHVKPSGELYYIPEKKVKQMLYVVNKLKKCSLESIVSDVTWESSTTEGDDDDDEDQFILDFKTDKVLAKANHCELLAHEIEQYYYTKSGDGPSTCSPKSAEAPPNKTDYNNLRRSISLPIIKVPKVTRRLKKVPVVSKAVSDDNLNLFLADITQHRLVYTRSIEQVEKKEMFLNVDDEIDPQILERHVRFASNELKKFKELDFIEDVKPSTSKTSVETDSNRPTFYDLIDQDVSTYDEINDTIYREINEVKASICGTKDKMGTKFRPTKDDFHITFDNYDKESLPNIEEKEKYHDLSRPSTSSGIYQKEMEPLPISEDERDITYEQPKFNKAERYLLEKLLKDEHVLNKTKQLIKMKRREKQDDDTEEQLTDEQILDKIKNKPKRFNVYTLQKLQTEFDTSTIGDGRKAMVTDSKKSKVTQGKRTMAADARKSMTIPCCVSMNPPEILSTTDGSEIEMKSFTENDSDSITDCELSDFDESVCRKYLKKYKKKVPSKQAKASTKLSFISLSNIPIIGRLFQRKS
ncbi:uncharacterized protein LOC123298792 [Chrysoperla carnea]|uniref:uncharacterized protein LOC123298792 n=1 Tax=Chrysoperla carnea TaxID=189513 RepID=UPI001D0693DB|nr:uncharacterized protein LOC123298792 [Chrysoperla carnea]